MMKAYQSSIKQSTQQRYKKEGRKSKQNEETTKWVACKGNINKSCTQNPLPLFARSISYNENGRTPEREHLA
jgi:hypothetical protein